MIRTKISAAVQWLIVGFFGGDVHVMDHVPGQ